MRRVFVFLIFTIFITSCYFPARHTEITAAQQAEIADTLLNDYNAGGNVENILNNMYVSGSGTRYATNPNIVSVYQDFLTGRFLSYGYAAEDIKTPTVTCNNPGYITSSVSLTMNNIIVTKQGTDLTAPPVLVTAHWDSVPNSPAIDDNASGCAGVLEIARLASTRTFRNTIIFILFAFEEENLLGSTLYTETMTQRPKSVINLEMIGFTSEKEKPYPGTDILLGFPTTGDFIGVFATDFSENLGLNFIYAIDRFVPDLKYYFLIADSNFANNPLLSLLMRSDHTPFWEKRIPALMITDTAELRDGAPYHSVNDVLGNINLEFHMKVTKAAFATVCIEAGIEVAP